VGLNIDPAIGWLMIGAGLVLFVVVVVWRNRIEEQGEQPSGAAVSTVRELDPAGPSDGRLPGWPAPGATPAAAADSPPTIVRTYRGAQQADTTAAFQADAAELAKHGYAPTTQSWAQGQWGCGAFLVALVLCIVLIGIFIFIYMLVVKPDGTLTVTYERTAPIASALPASQPSPKVIANPGANVEARLTTLERLRSTGAISADEYAARRNKILDDI